MSANERFMEARQRLRPTPSSSPQTGKPLGKSSPLKLVAKSKSTSPRNLEYETSGDEWRTSGDTDHSGTTRSLEFDSDDKGQDNSDVGLNMHDDYEEDDMIDVVASEDIESDSAEIEVLRSEEDRVLPRSSATNVDNNTAVAFNRQAFDNVGNSSDLDSTTDSEFSVSFDEHGHSDRGIEPEIVDMEAQNEYTEPTGREAPVVMQGTVHNETHPIVDDVGVVADVPAVIEPEMPPVVYGTVSPLEPTGPEEEEVIAPESSHPSSPSESLSLHMVTPSAPVLQASTPTRLSVSPLNLAEPSEEELSHGRPIKRRLREDIAAAIDDYVAHRRRTSVVQHQLEHSRDLLKEERETARRKLVEREAAQRISVLHNICDELEAKSQTLGRQVMSLQQLRTAYADVYHRQQLIPLREQLQNAREVLAQTMQRVQSCVSFLF
ncbi:MAG: hypothetical protein MHM6MM_004123 [Cercozoa sp. M6MM]